ncbi:pre-toxin TG domain-containing protein [Lysinibacillus xylanilyticus]|uniref:pre-toxin TG domain-containing protein n=1 Tax=Lysinibacillus xylanilyticus TaxID=582475 RepID=UPI003D06ADC7
MSFQSFGNAKAVFETSFGFNPFTRKKLSAVDQGISAVGILGGGYATEIINKRMNTNVYKV